GTAASASSPRTTARASARPTRPSCSPWTRGPSRSPSPSPTGSSRTPPAPTAAGTRSPTWTGPTTAAAAPRTGRRPPPRSCSCSRSPGSSSAGVGLQPADEIGEDGGLLGLVEDLVVELGVRDVLLVAAPQRV